MAMTAWSAKVSKNLICFSEKGCTSVSANRNNPDGYTFPQQRRGKNSPNARTLLRKPSCLETRLLLCRKS